VLGGIDDVVACAGHALANGVEVEKVALPAAILSLPSTTAAHGPGSPPPMNGEHTQCHRAAIG
jgi:hypothetical protein